MFADILTISNFKLTIMKKISICIMSLIFTATSFCQQTKPLQPLTREEYLTKSKTQKVFGFILLGAGATTLIIIRKGNTDLNAVGPLAVVGTLATLGSIPLFIASGRNKRRAMKASTSLKFEKTQSIQHSGISFHSFPAMSLKINL